MTAVMSRLRVLLADDHETVRAGLRVLFEGRGGMDVVREAGDGHSAVEMTRGADPDVVVLDISMSGMTGIQAARKIKCESPRTAIVVLTRHDELAYVAEMLSAGASAYVLKQSPFDELLAAVKIAASGGRYIDRRIADAAAREPGPDRGITGSEPVVSDRETAVLQLAAKGFSNKDIGNALNIAVKTVEVHKSNAMRKLRLRDRVELLRFAVAKGWLRDP
jgi:DNA-binding NarL/FixJ family response regulator